MTQFNFMEQTARVETLLKACVEALPHIVSAEASGQMEAALREFERFGAPTLWSASDADSSSEYGLTPGERREAVGRFIQEYELHETDWMALDKCARDVLEERQFCIRVEYDPQYTGGDYEGSGQYAYVPTSLIAEMAKQNPDSEDGVALAFTKLTKLDSTHIVRYTLDEHFNQDGEPIEIRDIADDDLFVCVHCSSTGDIEDSIETSAGKICEACEQRLHAEAFAN